MQLFESTISSVHPNRCSSPPVHQRWAVGDQTRPPSRGREFSPRTFRPRGLHAQRAQQSSSHHRSQQRGLGLPLVFFPLGGYFVCSFFVSHPSRLHVRHFFRQQSGKSTYLKTVAVLTVMAHVGCYSQFGSCRHVPVIAFDAALFDVCPRTLLQLIHTRLRCKTKRLAGIHSVPVEFATIRVMDQVFTRRLIRRKAPLFASLANGQKRSPIDFVLRPCLACSHMAGMTMETALEQRTGSFSQELLECSYILQVGHIPSLRLPNFDSNTRLGMKSSTRSPFRTNLFCFCRSLVPCYLPLLPSPSRLIDAVWLS